MITDSTLEQLEFPKLLKLIADYTHSEPSRRAVFEIRPLGELETIRQRQTRIEEIRKLHREGTPLPLAPFVDLGPLLSRVRPLGAILEPLELAAFIPVLQMMGDLQVALAGRPDLPRLQELAAGLRDYPNLLRRLGHSLDEEGNILDQASPLLAELRSQVRQVEARIRKQLTELIQDHQLAALLQDDFITQRSGRWVIPVRMEARKQIRGVVHDVSRSGETAFVEPLAIIQLSNELENLTAEQKAEENRILRDLSAGLREIAGDLDGGLKVVVVLDLLQGAASLADELQCEPPGLTAEGSIRLVQGRHPLLELAFRRQEAREALVPLDLQLGEDARVMVITGSNAGGKTVALKTVGILTVMALSGLPVPARDSSVFPLIENLLVDIGDEQSIESSLSTFSAHIQHISAILKNSADRTLVLLDELGTSTDPDEGAALACAVLTRLREQGALVLATTHLTGIKVFTERSQGMVNAAMEFDPRTLKPLYRLKTGQPGLSHALEVAGQYGLDPEVVAQARELLGGQKVELDRSILDLNNRRSEYEKGLEEIRLKETRLSEQERELAAARDSLPEERKRILAETYREASDYLVTIRRQMQALLEEIKVKGRTRGREVLKEVEKTQTAVNEEWRSVADEEAVRPLGLEEIEEGRFVYVPSLGYDAEVVALLKKQNRVRLRAEGFEIEVPVTEIGASRGKRPAPRSAPAVKTPVVAEPFSRLNLIGLRVEEALSRLEPFLNQAALGGLREVVIVHGFGEGILNRAVREHLKKHPLIKTFRPGVSSEGGAGATIAVLH
ncbi:MAG: endonuclease MutS2 [Deltaproteobacteria bacterium]|nr:endonuclease MutS2 [Deltaproteobacteria bacterium]